ncbi:MAG: hypothetical protein KY476_07730 [Planctomycetes bacterium]|nr:hypothetical protein [Planctomycetota bacterium]
MHGCRRLRWLLLIVLGLSGCSWNSGGGSLFKMPVALRSAPPQSEPEVQDSQPPEP